jgi:hypothetical protein
VALRGNDIIDLKTAFVGGREQAYHVRISECATERDGYAEVTKERIRELNREPTMAADGEIVALGAPTWVLHEKRKGEAGTEVWVEIAKGAFAPLKEIPLATFWTGEREGSQYVSAPLYAAADKQIELYRALSRKDEAYTKAGFPMLTANGLGAPTGKDVVRGRPRPHPLRAGAASLLGLHPARRRLPARDHRGRREDPRRAAPPRHAAADAEVRRGHGHGLGIEGAKAHSAVEAWAIGLKDMLEQAFVFTAAWLNESDTVEVEVDTDFSVEAYAQAPLDALQKARAARDITQRTYWGGLRRFDVLPPDFDPDAEETDLATELQGLEPEIDPNAPITTGAA